MINDYSKKHLSFKCSWLIDKVNNLQHIQIKISKQKKISYFSLTLKCIVMLSNKKLIRCLLKFLKIRKHRSSKQGVVQKSFLFVF
jgi:hypothetical protein